MVGKNLLVDAGGTHARLSWHEGGTRDLNPVVFQCDRYACFDDLVDDFVKQHPPQGLWIGALIAAAGPVYRGHVKWTNRVSWQLHEEVFCRSRGIKFCKIFNDLQASAMAIPGLSRDDMRLLDTKKPLDCGNKLIVGLGTGLGMAALVHHEHRWIPVATEAGHMIPPQVLLKPGSSGKKQHHEDMSDVRSVEEWISGSGLPNLHQLVTSSPARMTTHEILEYLHRGDDRDMEEVIRLQLKLLGAWLGQVILCYNAWSGVYFTGGMVDRLLPYWDIQYLRENMNPRENMTSASRFSESLSNVALIHVRHPYLALLGLMEQDSTF